jgi:hypothetical protein
MQTQVEIWLAQAQPTLVRIVTAAFDEAGVSLPAANRVALSETAVAIFTGSLREETLDRAPLYDLAQHLTSEGPLTAALLAIGTRMGPEVRAYIRADLADQPELRAELLRRLSDSVSRFRALLTGGQVEQLLTRLGGSDPRFPFATDLTGD